MSDWNFRILSGSPSDFASDLNAMIVANGGASLTLLDANGALVSCLLPPGIIRMDFDTLTLPSGFHVNARLTPLPKANATASAAAMAFWSGAISSWFGQGGSQPVCPTLTSYTNSTLGTSDPLQVGGQVWKSTGKTLLISPAPSVPKRVWE